MAYSISFLACQALEEEVRQVSAGFAGKSDLCALPSSLDRYPSVLYGAIDDALGRLTQTSARVVVVYGHCCLLMDDLVRRHGAFRTQGDNCYEILAGSELMRHTEDNAPAYYLTPFHCRDFDRVVRDGFGSLGQMRRRLSGVSRLVYLNTGIDERLVTRAAAIAGCLGLPLVTCNVGLTHLAAAIQNCLRKGSPDDASTA